MALIIRFVFVSRVLSLGFEGYGKFLEEVESGLIGLDLFVGCVVYNLLYIFVFVEFIILGSGRY